MPRDGSGAYTLPSGNPVTTGTLIQSTWANPTMADVAVQLNNVLTRDGLLGPVLPFKIVDGTVATPGLAFSSEPGTGFYRSAASVLNWATVNAIVDSRNASSSVLTSYNLYPRLAGQSQLILNADPAGTANTTSLLIKQDTTQGVIQSLGIGTGIAKPLVFTASAYTFTTGAASFTTAGAVGTLVLTDTGANGANIKLIGDGATTPNKYIRAQGGVFQILNSAYTVVALSLSDAGALAVASTIAGTNITATGTLASTGAATFNGLTTVNNTLNVNGAINSSGTMASGGFSTGGGSYVAGVRTGGSMSISGNISAAGIYGTYLYSSGAMDILGNMGAGGTMTATQGHHFPGNGSSGLVSDTYALSGSTRIAAMVDASSVGVSNTIQSLHNPGVDARWRFWVNGVNFDMIGSGVGNSSGGWVATSDRRVKKNLKVITNALDKLEMLTGYTFDKMDVLNMDGTPQRRAGIIAQDFQSVLPEGVLEGTDEMKTLSVFDPAVIALLVNSVKELHALVH